MPSCLQCGVSLEWETVTGRCAACEPTTFGLRRDDARPDDARREDARRDEIPGYELLEPLGRGGMGEVRRARQRSLDRFVAIKLIHPLKGLDPSFAARFVREARLLARLNHPHIVGIYEFGECAGRPFLVMELVAGRNVRQLLHAGPVPPRTALDLLSQLCDAVGYAHEQGIVHRDIKPENILLDASGRVKIADFGLARLLQPDNALSALTQDGAVMGTLRYMAPEQLAGVPDVDARTDVYALGLVLYELLTGSLPHGLFRPPSHVVPLDARVDAVVLRALAQDRAERYATAREFHQALAAAISSPTAEVLPAGSEDDAETMEWRRPVSGHVPLPPARLIGRTAEIAEITRHCQTRRLVTLLGPGGTGKTRLAIEIARRTAPDWPHGAWFVELAEITATELLAPAIAHALDLKEGGGTVETLLSDHLRERQLLLVMDNCEQVPGAATLVATLLAASPGLRILATSRTPLHVRGEHEYPVAPLQVPAARPEGNTFESVSAAPAVQLFVERAQAVRADFRLTRENGRAVAEICRRLDGLPLALELAAARLRLFSPEALVPRLEHSLKLLTGGARELPERQRTLRGAMAWSYDLLTIGERALFRWLSVFSGTFPLEAVEEVCAGLPDRHQDFEILDGLTALVEHSLVRAAPDTGRFEMLVTLREYAAEQLAAEGEMAAARAAFVAWGRNLLESVAPHLDSAAAGPWMAKLNGDWDNVRSVLQFVAQEDPAAALSLAANTWYAGYQNGRLAETRERLLTLMTLAGSEAPAAARAAAAHGAGTLCWVTGNVAGAWRLFGDALAIRRPQGDAALLAATLNNMGVLAREQTDYDVSERYHAEALALRRVVGKPGPLAASLANLGLVASDRGDLAHAHEYMAEALQLYRQLGDEGKVATVLGNLGRTAMLQGRPDESARYAAEALALHEKIGNSRGIILANLSLAAADSVSGNLHAAEGAALTSLEASKELGDAWLQAYSQSSLGFVAEKRGQSAVALGLYRDSLRRRSELGDLGGQGEMVERLAVVLATLGEDLLAARLLGAEEALHRRVGYVRFPQFRAPTETVLETLRVHYGAETVAREIAAGAALPWDEAVRLALG